TGKGCKRRSDVHYAILPVSSMKKAEYRSTCSSMCIIQLLCPVSLIAGQKEPTEKQFAAWYLHFL
ncbi:hypothetical protein, partial [Paenibacillus macquariensis]|uniref:hypothetical protein n=1 Tax=Paenibacillus macquariensis TaxID=948756 RepID=UPI001B804C27